MILAQAALVKFSSPEELKAITYQRIEPNVIHLSTIFNRGVTTVLFLLSACGFDIKEVNNLRRDNHSVQFCVNQYSAQNGTYNVRFQHFFSALIIPLLDCFVMQPWALLFFSHPIVFPKVGFESISYFRICILDRHERHLFWVFIIQALL